ncbi:MAG: HD domain-containing phosphohydrolase, partial [Myxococcaceae bacterium]
VLKLGERLVEAGLITAEAVDQALSQQKLTGHLLGDCLVEIGLIQEAALLRFLASEFQTRFVSAEKLAKVKIDQPVLDKVPVRMAEAQVFLPLAMDKETKVLSIVMSTPQNKDLVKEIALVTEMDEVYAYVGLRSAILAGIKKHYYGDKAAFSAMESGGIQALKSDVSQISGAYETNVSSPGTGSRHAPGLQFETDPRMRASRMVGTSISKNHSTQLRDALGAVRGGVGENDFVETLNILVGLLELQRKELRGHSGQLARNAATVARRMGLQARDVTNVSIAAYLHDIAKRHDRHYTLAGNSINPDWKVEAKKYIRAPIKMFETVHLPGAVNAMLAQLYEAFDGSGIPQGAKGEEIAAGARILSAVDSYLDLTKNPTNALGRILGKNEALDHLAQEAGKLYDPVVVDLLGRLHSGELLRQRISSEGRQVLVADPDEAVRTDMLEALSRLGMVVHTVAKLDGAIDAVLAGEAEVIVMGLRFGAGDIVALAQFVRARAESAGLPLVVIGEPSDAPTRDRLVQATVSAMIPMPLNPDEAAKTVAALYEERLQNGGPGRSVQGSFDELAPIEMVKLLAQGRKSGRMVVKLGTQEGFLHFERGRVVFASFAGKLGDPAVHGLLASELAEFTFEPEALLLDMPHLDKDLEVVARELEQRSPSAAAS